MTPRQAPMLFAAAAFVLLLPPSARAEDECPEGPDCPACATALPPLSCQFPGDPEIVVYYDPSLTTAERAGWVAETACAARDILPFFPFQFDPACSGVPPYCPPVYRIWILDMGPAGPRAVIPPGTPHILQINTLFLSEAADFYEVEAAVFHEWFHWIQACRRPINEMTAWGDWVIEGTATFIMDKFDSSLDHDPDSFYLEKANEYLGAPGMTLNSRRWEAALWWTYFSEQLGLEFDEPARGVNAVRDFLERALPGQGIDAMGHLRETIQGFDPTRNLESLFRDFAIANHTKMLDLGDIPFELRDRYRYFDESPLGWVPSYRFQADINYDDVDFGFDVDKEFKVQSWSARYLTQVVDTAGPCSAVGMRGTVEGGGDVYWVLIGLKDGPGFDRVAKISWLRGESFHRTFLNQADDPFVKLVAVVVGLDRIRDVKVAFGTGPISTQIVSPTQDDPATVPPRERFGVEVRVSGPPTLTPPGPGTQPSLGGLEKNDFLVKLKSATTLHEFPVHVNFMHRLAEGTYGLTCTAPDIPLAAEGSKFHLRVCVCARPDGTCGGTEVQTSKSVLIGDFITHQVLALDVSGSMEGEGKLDAAKQMASFLINSAARSSSLGLVAFAGNGSERQPFLGPCDMDAVLLSELAPMSSQHSLDLSDAIYNGHLTASGWTSLGDGILVSASELIAQIEPADKKSIMLLTDGMENEAAFWEVPYGPCSYDPVRNLFDPAIPGSQGAGIRIDSRGFGSDADMGLLDRIAQFTGGREEAVPTDPPSIGDPGTGGGAAAGSEPILGPDPMTLQVSNRLAESFRSIQEDALGLDRFFYAAVDAQSHPTPVTIPVVERNGGGVQGAVFGFNWPAGSSVTIELRNRSGALITNLLPNWRISKPPTSAPQTNVVYHYSAVLPVGNYTATITANPPAQVICLLSGKVVHGVDTDLTVHPTAQDQGPCAQRYGRGLPVLLTLTAADLKGGVGSMDLVARIRNPEGTVNRRTLFDDGDHDDGEAGDGIYANTYPRTPFARLVGVDPGDFALPHSTPNLGTYSVNLAVSGKNGYGEPFTRYESASFTVIESSLQGQCIHDSDEDGLPDRWENLVGLDPSDPTDAKLDNDNDGLMNYEEFFQGTHPFQADSDWGGESDGSEVANRRDPLWERDDQMPPIENHGLVLGTTDLRVDPPAPGTLLLRFPANMSYRKMHIYRSKAADPSWSDFVKISEEDVHAASPRGLYRDTGLPPHVKYHYYLVAEGLSGASTAPTDFFSAAAPPPELQEPGGKLRLNCGGPLVFDAAGREWIPDTPYLEGSPGTTSVTAAAINMSLITDPSEVPMAALQSGRSGRLHYQISVPNGAYQVVLYFSENCLPCVAASFGGTGCPSCRRQFNIEVEGETLQDYNPADSAVAPPGNGAGATFKATEVRLDVTVLDGQLDIRLLDRGPGNPPGDPIIQAIAVTNATGLPFLIRGDCDGNGSLTSEDATFLLQYLFSDAEPPCLAACDFNGDGSVAATVTDALYLLNHLYLSAPPPPPPHACGPGTPADTDIGCVKRTCN